MIKIIFVTLLFPLYSWAQCDFPVNQLNIDEFQPSSISKSQFLKVIDKAKREYAREFALNGCPLEIIPSWSDGTVNAQAWKEAGLCKVEMFGGFARFGGITQSAFTAVLCHEIGHHRGGFPFYTGSDMSVEGQSDYYATLVCMKRLGVPSAAASLALAKALGRLAGEAQVPARDRRDTSQVNRTYQGHPRAQCRLDTMDAGRVSAARPRCWFKP